MTAAPALKRSARRSITTSCPSVSRRAPRRDDPVEPEVHDQVTVMVHVVLDHSENGRPALDLLAAPARYHLQGLFFGEPRPYLRAVLVAFPKRLQDLCATLQAVEAGI